MRNFYFNNKNGFRVRRGGHGMTNRKCHPALDAGSILIFLFVLIGIFNLLSGCSSSGSSGSSSPITVSPTNTPVSQSLSGTIFDIDGRPISGALVVLYSNSSRDLEMLQTVSTGINGGYIFLGVAGGFYRLAMWVSQESYGQYPDTPDAADNVSITGSQAGVANLQQGKIIPLVTPTPAPTQIPSVIPIVYSKKIGYEDTPRSDLYKYQIYIVNSDGTGDTRITNNQYSDLYPCFTNNYSKILFSRYFVSSSSFAIYSMSPGGSEQTRYITLPSCTYRNSATFQDLPFDSSEIYPNTANNSQSDSSVFLSNWGVSDGPKDEGDSYILYYYAYTINEVWIKKEDGTCVNLHDHYISWLFFYSKPDMVPVGLLQLYTEDITPSIAYSPLAGKNKILFASNFNRYLDEPYHNHAIFICDGDQNFPINMEAPALVTKLTENDADYRNPTLSPDGTKIAYAREDGEVAGQHTYDVWIMNVDGTNPINLTNSPNIDDFDPFFLADGKIVFSSKRTGAVFLYTMNMDGTDVFEIPVAACFPKEINIDYSNSIDVSHLKSLPLKSLRDFR